jgi:uncharacterized caspase-like protein
MQKILRFTLILLTFVLSATLSRVGAQTAEKRIALVIGNANYQATRVETAANDAGLIAQTLQAAGFDVVGARDLDEDSLRRAFRDFVEKASGSGPDTVAFVYFSGYGLQLEGENYLVPVDASISRDSDVPSRTIRASDYIKPLTALQLKASIVVLDAARRSPISIIGQPLAGGLALVEPGPGMLVAFNAAPGTIAPEEMGPYGAYAQALAEMIRQGGLSLSDLFDSVRLRVNEATRGAQVPWNSSRIETAFVFFERSPDAPPLPAAAEQTSAIRSRPIRDLGAQDAYLAALQRDTLGGYAEFLAAYPDDPMARRVHAIIAARREAITWRRTYTADTPSAYWSYLRRYPHGPHAADARRRLAELAAALEPPAAFAMINYDVSPPPPEEIVYVDRPVLVFDDPDFDFPPPPPPPIYFLPPAPPDFVVLPPPVVIVEEFVLPIPVFVPIPIWCHPPRYLVPPPNNVIFANIHNTVVINHTTTIVTIKDQSGQVISSEPRLRPGAPAIGAALPPSVAKKADLIHPSRSNTSTTTSSGPNAPATVSRQAPGKPPLGQPLPGTNGSPLPPVQAKTLVQEKPLVPGKSLVQEKSFVQGKPLGMRKEAPPIVAPKVDVQPPTGLKPAPSSTTVETPPPPPPGAVRKSPLTTTPALPQGDMGHKLPPSEAIIHASPSAPATTARKPSASLTTVDSPRQPGPTYKPAPSVIRHLPPPPSAPTAAQSVPPPAMVHRSLAPAIVHSPPAQPIYRPASPPPATYHPPSPPAAAYHAQPPAAVRAQALPPAVNSSPPPQAARRSCQNCR